MAVASNSVSLETDSGASLHVSIGDLLDSSIHAEGLVCVIVVPVESWLSSVGDENSL